MTHSSVTTRYITPQHIATHCNALQHTRTFSRMKDDLRHPATHCNKLQHTATKLNTLHAHCNTLQHNAPRCNTLQPSAPRCNTLQHTRTNTLGCRHHPATRYITMQHTATSCNILQHAATHRYLGNTEGLRVPPCGTLQLAATRCNRLQQATTQGITLQHTATGCNRLQQAATGYHKRYHAATHWYLGNKEGLRAPPGPYATFHCVVIVPVYVAACCCSMLHRVSKCCKVLSHMNESHHT